MKICLIVENARQIGGGDYAQFKYAEYLAKRHHRVTVFAQFRQEFMDQLVSHENLELHFRGGIKPIIRGAGRINQLWRAFYLRWSVFSWIERKENRPDVLLGYSKKSAILADRLGSSLGIPCAHVVFETPDWMSRDLGALHNEVYQGGLKREWEATREVYRRARWLLPNSELTREEVAMWTGRPVEPAIYAGFDDPGTTPDDPAAGRHILYIGRLDVTKNVHDLIDAVALMKSPPPVIIAGRGHDENELKARARSRGVNAIFPGHVTDQQKWQLIRDCYFLVFPTSFEGFGMPPGEALSCCKPVVCSDIPILREIYGDHVEYFKLHDVSALSNLMQKLLDDPAYRRRRGIAGRDFVLSRYTWTHCAERIESVLLSG